ncbi:hypothetical protein Hsw_2040 [Hymenobacter swuensis DY53]|uniref:Uncharacterized protein n=2 Tax=Hymenobacter TaxID=89966 RepID=W8F7C8_9BACT|nr:hypothetical protein Hsw_2040 [Hymenobacter swuensis DY53]
MFSNILSGLIGGLLVWLLQQTYLNYRENKKKKETIAERAKELEKQKTITLQNTDKVITGEAIWRLKPGSSVELMRHILGIPLKYSDNEQSIFDTFSDELVEASKKYYSYLYLFKNANIKICTQDNMTIDAITICAINEPVTVPTLNYALDEEIGTDNLAEAKVNQTLIDKCQKHEYISTRIDSSFALQLWIPNPIYLSYTYFGHAPDVSIEYAESKDPSLFLDKEIWGLCLSNNNDAFFIFDIETR